MSAADMPDNLVQFQGIEVIPKRPAFEGVWGHQLPIQPAEYLVEGLLPRRAYSLIYSRRGGGKSFLAVDLAYRGALGLPFLGHEILDRFGSVIFVGEKKSRFGKRPRAWLQANGLEGTLVPVLVVEGVPNLLDPDSVSDCIEFLNETARPMLAGAGVPLDAVFLDTLARCLPGGSVSDQAHASQGIEGLQRIVDEATVAVIPTAHVAKGVATSEATAKGAGEWEDAADAVLRIEREGMASLRTITNTKQSDGPEAGVLAFELPTVELGQTKRGRLITSCVISQVDTPENLGTSGRRVSLSPDALKVHEAIGRMFDEGQHVPAPDVPGVPPGKQAVVMRLLRQRAMDLGLRSGEAPDDHTDAAAVNRWEENRKKAFERGLAALEKAGKVRREGSLIWEV